MQRGDVRDLLLAEVGQDALAAHCAAQTPPLTGRAVVIGAVQQEVLQTRPAAAAPLKRPPLTDRQRVIFIGVITLWTDTSIKEESGYFLSNMTTEIIVFTHLFLH